MSLTDFQQVMPMPERDKALLPLLDIPGETKLVLVALPAGSEVPPHKAPFPASVQLLAGRIEALKGETWHPVAPGERIVFDADELHGVKALESSYFLVTHMRALARA